MKIIGTQEELKWVRRALANNCEGCIFEERCNQNASEELKKHGKTLTSCEEFMAFPGGGSCFGILRNPVHEEEK